MPSRALYSSLAEYYDRFYWWKDYGREVDFLARVFDAYGAEVRSVLEVACGTGSHTVLMAQRGYGVTGVDISAEILRVARKKVAGRADFVRGDMRDLQAAVGGKTYDAVVCLFSSISYNQTLRDLERTVAGMHDRAKPGGLVVFDTHFTERGFMDGYRGEDIFDDGRAMGARLSVSKREGRVGTITFSYLIRDGKKTILLRDDLHRLGLFNRPDFLRAMRRAGLTDLRTYTEWSIEPAKKATQFPDAIFVGRRPSG